MSREKTARLIPNAIQVCTKTEKVSCAKRNQKFRFNVTLYKHITDYSTYFYIFTLSISSLPSQQERKVTRVFSACGKTN